MPKYLLQVTYTAEGAKGVLKDGGSKRINAARALVESAGGTLETMYFAFGETDVYATADLPNAGAAAAVSLALAASGAVTGRMTVLLTPEELDRAVQKPPTYRAPGQ